MLQSLGSQRVGRNWEIEQQEGGITELGIFWQPIIDISLFSLSVMSGSS